MKMCPKVGAVEWPAAWACVHGGPVSGKKKWTWSRVCWSFYRTMTDRSFIRAAYSLPAHVGSVVTKDSKEIVGVSANIYGQSIR